MASSKPAPCKARADIRLSKIRASPFGRLCIWGPCRVPCRLKCSAQGHTMVLTKLEKKTCQVRCLKNHPAEGRTDSILCLAHALSALTSYPLICQCMQEAKRKTTCIFAENKEKVGRTHPSSSKTSLCYGLCQVEVEPSLWAGGSCPFPIESARDNRLYRAPTGLEAKPQKESIPAKEDRR